MPFPGVPKQKTGKLDECVKKVMSSSDFKKKHGKKKDKKSIAIAICRASMKV